MKKIVLFIVLISGLQNLSAQLIEDDIIEEKDSLMVRSLATLSDEFTVNPPEVITSSPQSQIFEQYLNHEISEYNGLPNIEIPLYEIKLKDLTIPITLSYHASGIKYMQYDGDIGAGWSIGAGGYRLTRTVKGYDDFGPTKSYTPLNRYSKVYTYADFSAVGSDYRRRDCFLYGLSIDPDNLNSPMPEGAIAGLSSGGVIAGDGQYDKFSYMLPTTNGQFIITDRQNMSVAIMDERQDKINIQRKECKITDTSGIQYYLGGSYNGEELNEKERFTLHETTWVLREIKTPSNESIYFRYKSIKAPNDRYKEAMKGGTIIDIPYYPFNYTISTLDLDLPGIEETSDLKKFYVSYNDNRPKYDNLLFLDEIETDNILVRFERGNLLDMTHILKRITVKDKLSNKIIKEIKLENQIYPTAINTAASYCSTPSHILLNTVTFPDKKYKMNYYSPPSNYRGAYPDQWNNYNFNLRYTNEGKKMFLHKEFENEKYLWSCTFLSFTEARTEYSISTISKTELNQYLVDRSVDADNIMSFSLKNIQFPTGGNTEYIYEPHQTDKQKGGGLRIKKIVSKADANKSPVISEFNYRNGVASFDLDYKAFIKESYTMFHDYLRYKEFIVGIPRTWIVGVRCNRTFTMNTSGDFNLSEYNIYYRNVDVLQYDEVTNKYNGKKSIEFNLPYRPLIDYYEGFWMGRYPYPLPDEYDRKKGIFKTCDGQKPVPKTISYFNETDELVKKEEYEYEKTKNDIYEGLKVNQRMSTTGAYIPSYPQTMQQDRNDYHYISSYYDVMRYQIETGTDIVSSKTTTLFTSQGKLITTEGYEYNDNYQLKKIIRKNDTDSIIDIKELKYPQDFASGNNIYKQMVDKNIISPIIEKTERSSENQELRKIKTEYANFSNLLLPSLIKTTSGGTERTELTFGMYDSKGNLLQYTTLDGTNIFYLWSYKHRYPVAEIRNVEKWELESALYKFGATILGHSGTLAAGFDDELLRNELPDALITTYTYEPSVGITGIIDPKGVKITYVYDEFNRLKYIEDNEGRRLNEYKYHYRENN